jgi:membrane-associated protease RseP (regulator of RpoE activity)
MYHVDWLPVVLLIILILYGAIAWIIRKKRIREDIITFYGPIMAIKSHRIGFFDRFRSAAPILRIYGSLGIAMVVIVSVLMTFLVIFSLRLEVAQPPPVQGVFEPRNWFVIPGVNQFIPFTLPVILAIAVTIAIHELGHGILCRIEGILVKSMGVLLFIVPIGFFVEPDEEELERTPPVPKSRMFGAGITNNLVLGFACFGVLVLLLGAVAPVPGPIIYMLQGDSPAYNASVPLGSVIREVNGQTVATIGDISKLLNGTRPGDSISLTVLPSEVVRDLPATGPRPVGTTYTFNLTSAPDRSYGFMGVSYYNTDELVTVLRSFGSAEGFLLFSYLPIDILENRIPQLHHILMNTPDEAFFRTPFPLFWGMIHFLFWCGWFNFMVGTFNALPMIPFDGGFIMKEGVAGLLRRLGKPQLVDRITLIISLVIFALIILIVTIPSIANVITILRPGG